MHLYIQAAAHAASRHALMTADRERILALTEELKTQQRQAKTPQKYSQKQKIPSLVSLNAKKTLLGH